MKITVMVPDKTVVVSGVGHELPDLDWSVFDGDPSTPWDDIRCICINGDSGYVEYRQIVTQPAHRPNIIPPNLAITEAEFIAKYGFVIEAWQAADAKAKAEEAEAARQRAELAAKLATAKQEIADKSGNPDEIETLKSRLAAIEADQTELLKKLAGAS